MSIANLTSIPNDNCINPITILYIYNIFAFILDSPCIEVELLFSIAVHLMVGCTIVHTCICIHFVSSVAFVDFLIKSSLQKKVINVWFLP